MKISSVTEATAFLKKLDGEVREFYPTESWNRQPASTKLLRRLTADGWDMITKIIEAQDFPCVLNANCYGFTLHIHAEGDRPDAEPETLIIIQDNQFPFPSAELGFSGQEETLCQLALITHSQRNLELLAQYHFEPMMEPLRYAY